MAFSGFKTLINVGINTVNDYKVPVSRTIEKNKEYETRFYEKTKYMAIKYKTISKSISNEKASSDKEKKPNDDIMNKVWRLMKYTQGNNKSNLNMKFYMPVFVEIDTLNNGNVDSEPNKNHEIEITIMVALPPEYQEDKNNPSKDIKEPPLPNEEDEIQFIILDEFKCYVKSFSGFAGDNEFEIETNNLRSLLRKSKDLEIKFVESKCICISYDPPFKLFGRRNEVILIAV